MDEKDTRSVIQRLTEDYPLAKQLEWWIELPPYADFTARRRVGERAAKRVIRRILLHHQDVIKQAAQAEDIARAKRERKEKT